MSVYSDDIGYIQNGEQVEAAVVNRPLQRLKGNDDYLFNLIQALTYKEANIALDVPFSSTVAVGTPVYWNSSNSRFEPAQANTTAFQVIGVCYVKNTTTSGDLVVGGRVALDIEDVLQTGDVMAAGQLYLSLSEAGKLTYTKSSVMAVPVLFADNQGTITVNPYGAEEPRQAVVLKHAAVHSNTVVGNPVFWNTTDNRFEKSTAGTNSTVGVVWQKPTSTTAHIVLCGKVDLDFDDVITEGGSAASAMYFLSSTTAGEVTATRPADYQVPVMIADGDGNVFVQIDDRYIPPLRLLSYSGSTTDAYEAVYTRTSANGLIGIGTIKNTHGSNVMDLKEEVTDAFGTSSSQTNTVAGNASRTLNLSADIGTARPPYTTYTVSVRSNSAGNAATYSAKTTITQV